MGILIGLVGLVALVADFGDLVEGFLIVAFRAEVAEGAAFLER